MSVAAAHQPSPVGGKGAEHSEADEGGRIADAIQWERAADRCHQWGAAPPTEDVFVVRRPSVTLNGIQPTQTNRVLSC